MRESNLPYFPLEIVLFRSYLRIFVNQRHVDFLFSSKMVGDKSLNSFFFFFLHLISERLRTTCWRLFFVHEMPCQLSQKSIDHKYEGLFLVSQILFHWSLCLSLYQYHTILITAVSFEIRKCSSFSELLWLFWILFCRKFRISFPV